MCTVIAARAANSSQPSPQFVRQEWTVDSGFPGGPIRAIRQLSDGYLWLGTQKGLIRFDGQEFRLNSPQPPSFQNDQISDVMKGPDGKLWVVFWGAGLLRYDDGSLQALPARFGQPGIQVTASLSTHNGSILLADSVNGIERVSNDGTTILAPPSALPGYALVISLAESDNGTIWLGTASQGLFSLKNSHILSVLSGAQTQRINCVLPTGESSLWLGAENGLFNWDGTRLSRVPLPKQADGAQVLTMLRDRRSNVWVGTSRGLVRIDDRRTSSFESSSSESGGITALFEDREGNVWAGGAQGLERITHKTFEAYGPAESLPSEVNGPIHVDPADRTWAAPQHGGIDLISASSVQHVKSPFLDRNVIYSIASDNGNLWVGTQSGGLARVTYRNGIVATKTYTHADGLAEDSVFSVSIGRDGAIWAGTLTGGVSRLKGDKFDTYRREDGLASNTVSSSLQTRDGTMWFATPNGLSSLSNGHWSTYTTRDGLASNSVNCLLEDGSGILWVGTSEGISLLEHGKIRSLPNVPVSLQGQIFGFALDPAGRVWGEAATQIVRIRVQRLPDGIVTAVKVREYDTRDGLPKIEGVRRDRSVASGTDGRIWFSLREGVTWVDSRSVRDDSVPALTHVDVISADGKTIPFTDSLTIPPLRRRLIFGYTGISLTIPERVRFRYFLDGFDRTWSAPTDAHEAVYTNLGPGPYRFRVVASNSDGLWNGAETSVAFRIQPAFWQTSWFRVLLGTIFLMGLWIFFRMRTSELTRQLNLRFQGRLAERNRIAQELHDTLLQSMQGLILRFQNVYDLLPTSPERAKEVLGTTLEKADLVLDEGRRAIMGIRSTSSADFDLAEVLRSAIAEPADGATVGRGRDFCVIWAEGVAREVRLDVRDDLCCIAREALHNAMQHAVASQIKVKISHGTDALRLQVMDNGNGMEPRLLQEGGRAGHWGLVGMRERAERIGATLTVSSNLGAGTDISLTLPAKFAYSPSQSRQRWWLRRSGKRRGARGEV